MLTSLADSKSSVSSICTTASAPSGTIAPVLIRATEPGVILILDYKIDNIIFDYNLKHCLILVTL